MASDIQNVTPAPPIAVTNSSVNASRTAVASPRAEVKPVERPSVTAVDEMSTVKAAAAEIESYLRSSGRELSIAFDDSLNRPVVRVIEPGTSKVIRQIPYEEVLQVARWINDTIIEPSKDAAIQGMLLRGTA